MIREEKYVTTDEMPDVKGVQEEKTQKVLEIVTKYTRFADAEVDVFFTNPNKELDINMIHIKDDKLCFGIQDGELELGARYTDGDTFKYIFFLDFTTLGILNEIINELRAEKLI